jgi:23S rRNA (adenine1618-N6)-methyltransferase
MATPTKKSAAKPGALHPRNLHQGRYDFSALCASCPELRGYLRPNPAGDQTIDFSDSKAVLCLNRALLAHYYHVKHWMIPVGYLCPPIPGRADYIHYLADLLASGNDGEVPKGKQVKVLDIGTGANCIYPIIGSQSYGWKFVATDSDSGALRAARAIVEANPCLTKLVRVVAQKDRNAIFRGVIKPSDHYDLTMCNPPFHSSVEEAEAGSQRKLKNLSKGKVQRGPAKLNFGGQNAELWCPGGEVGFINKMIVESVEFAEQVTWFTSLVSKSENLRPLEKALALRDAKRVEVVSMSQGQKISRFIAWSFRV